MIQLLITPMMLILIFAFLYLGYALGYNFALDKQSKQMSRVMDDIEEISAKIKSGEIIKPSAIVAFRAMCGAVLSMNGIKRHYI